MSHVLIFYLFYLCINGRPKVNEPLSLFSQQTYAMYLSRQDRGLEVRHISFQMIAFAVLGNAKCRYTRMGHDQITVEVDRSVQSGFGL